MILRRKRQIHRPQLHCIGSIPISLIDLSWLVLLAVQPLSEQFEGLVISARSIVVDVCSLTSSPRDLLGRSQAYGDVRAEVGMTGMQRISAIKVSDTTVGKLGADGSVLDLDIGEVLAVWSVPHGLRQAQGQLSLGGVSDALKELDGHLTSSHAGVRWFESGTMVRLQWSAVEFALARKQKW